MLTAEEIADNLGNKLQRVSPETPIIEAVKLMVDANVYGVLVQRNNKYVGIWTERDLLKNTIIDGFDPKTAKVGDYMSSPIITASYKDTVFQLIDKFLGHKVRHLLIEKKGEYIALLYVRDVIRAGLSKRTKDYNSLQKMVSYEFYEDWKWKKKNK